MSDSYKRKSYRYGLIILLNIIKVWNFTIWKRVTLLMKESLGPIIFLNIIHVWNFPIWKRVSMIFYRKKVRQAWNDYSVTFFIIWKRVIFLEKQIWIDIWVNDDIFLYVKQISSASIVNDRTKRRYKSLFPLTCWNKDRLFHKSFSICALVHFSERFYCVELWKWMNKHYHLLRTIMAHSDQICCH